MKAQVTKAKPAAKPYYILICQMVRPVYEADSKWFMEYGSYDREEVKEERASVLDGGMYRTRIVCCGDTDEDVMAAVQAANEGK